MQVQIVIVDGQLRLATQNGTFEEGKPRLEALLKLLKINDIAFSAVGEVETHRHDHGEEHVHGHVDA